MENIQYFIAVWFSETKCLTKLNHNFLFKKRKLESNFLLCFLTSWPSLKSYWIWTTFSALLSHRLTQLPKFTEHIMQDLCNSCLDCDFALIDLLLSTSTVWLSKFSEYTGLHVWLVQLLVAELWNSADCEFAALLWFSTVHFVLQPVYKISNLICLRRLEIDRILET